MDALRHVFTYKSGVPLPAILQYWSLIALANCNRRRQFVDNFLLTMFCWQFVDAKHVIGLFCTSSQSGFIYKLASESCYEHLNFEVDGLILLLYVKIAICSRLLQFARGISRSILQHCVTILQCCPQWNTGFDCNRGRSTYKACFPFHIWSNLYSATLKPGLQYQNFCDHSRNFV
jgi:hypothetical protein